MPCSGAVNAASLLGTGCKQPVTHRLDSRKLISFIFSSFLDTTKVAFRLQLGDASASAAKKYIGD
jgi:hypothetical protein